MPALTMSLEEILAELRQDEDFAKFPPEWQQQLAQQVQEHGLEEALKMNADWAAQNPNDPNAQTLTRWVEKGRQAASQTGLPFEQGAFNTAAPGLANQIAGDAARQQQVDELTKQTNAAYGNLGATLGQSIAHFDGQQYFAQNPDVAADYQAKGGQQGTGMTPDQFAEKHYKEYGQTEGRQATYTSAANQMQQGNAATAANSVIAAAKDAATSQLTALQGSIASMQQNLQGNLAAKATALQTAVSSLNQNLDTLDATQKQNLATQIATMQKDLEESIGAQKSALATEVSQLQGNSSAAAQARKAALDQEIAQLNAAQEPLNQARLQGAEALVTAVNLGLESTKDQIAADAAREGFVGPSSFTDATLARAGIDARQQGAQAVTGAKTANAADTRQIGILGATKGYSIADVLAGEQQQAENLGATGGAQLAAALAQGKQGLGDTGATGLRTIGDTTAGAKAGVGNTAATTTYADTVGGANDARTLNDTLSKGGYDLAATLAQQTQQAKNNQATANFSTGQNLYPSTVSASQALTQLPGAQAQTLTSLLPYGNAGTNNALSTLNWWGTPGTPPNPTVTLQQPSQTGNQTSQLGTGLLGSAFNIGAANNWWKTPTPVKPPVAPTTGNPDDPWNH